MPSVPDAAPGRPGACLNCGSTRVAEYCADCGQRNVEMRVPARALLVDAVEDGLSLDSRMGRSLGPFLLHPGLLTTEWVAGRRARYSSPLRMYLLTSAVFFLASGLAGDGGPHLVAGGVDLQAAREDARRELEASGAPPEVVAALRPALEGRGPGGADAGPAPDRALPEGTPEQHDRLRSHGWLGRAADDRWRALSRMSPEELRARVGAAFRDWVPRVMFFLVPAAVAILALLWRRRWLSEHVVMALHLHAFAFTVLTVLVLLRLVPWPGLHDALGPAVGLGVAAYVLVALRRVYGQPWRRTLPRAAAAGLLYVLAIGAGLVSVGLLALWFA